MVLVSVDLHLHQLNIEHAATARQEGIKIGPDDS